ncbi:MAG: DUF971 domain-containing protein [Acidobacteria bacterium]|nr:DUF971 domain-containing protein [Acidobacteriota bacterium]MBV9146733.1 DUF971 domain-containing protein [Acidobacteriota bacterium]MBV9437960.1 DUF971 domain-containing protein [Acidobacteriota bacterium]
MSHEPIKTGPAEEMSKVQAAELRRLPAEATDPKSVKVQKTTGQGVDIAWKDGHVSHYSFAWLRDACPCATCNEEREASGRRLGEATKPKPGALPMYKDPARPAEIVPVGRYAINFHWNDGHSSGIYSWEFLRRECPCESCRLSRAAQG